MQAFPKFQNDETAHVVVRLNKDEEMSLRLFMHMADKTQKVTFPHGVRLFYRSMGWYRLDTSNSFRAIEKLKLALSITRKWYKEYEAQRTKETQVLIAAAPNVPTEFRSNYEQNKWDSLKNCPGKSLQQIVAGKSVPASADKLQSLAQFFAH